MESDLQEQFHFFHGHYQPQQHHQKQTNTGLTRYQSAPSTYFSSILDKDFCEDFLSRPSSPETAKILARFMTNSGGNTTVHHHDVKQESPVNDSMTQVNQKSQIMASSTGNDTRVHQHQQQHSNYSASSQSFYQSQSKPPLPDHSLGSGMDYKAMTSKGMERLPQMKNGGGNNSNLVRHNSSPAGLFAKINIEFENGYAVMKSVGDFGDTPYSASNRPPPSGRISQIAEMSNKNITQNSQNQGGLGEARNSDYVTGYRMGGYWEDSRMMSVNTKGLTDEDRSLSGIDESDTQDLETGSPSPMLARHLSLPKTSSEISVIEKFLHLQDSVPCKIRAKRGCATHPRSIAERVRRTRISERMRKLQDLVPNMDKQTNTSDMLDLAVDYIKDLQMQVKTLSDNRAKCTCTDKQ